MEIIYGLEKVPYKFSSALFLAGPIDRSGKGDSWRNDAIQILKDIGFDGVVFNPEQRNGKWHGDHAAQVEWEDECLIS